MYSGSADGMVAKWNIQTGEPEPFVVKVGQPVYAMHFNGPHLLIGQAKGGIHVIDTGTKQELRHLQYQRLWVFDMAQVVRENLLVSASGDGTLAVIDASDYRLLQRIEVSAKKLRVIQVLANGRYLFVGGSDGYIRLFDTGYFNEIYAQKIHEGGVYAVRQISEEEIVTSGSDGYLRFWRMEEMGLSETRALPAHYYAIYQLGVHPDLPVLASASRDKTVKIWKEGAWRSPVKLERKDGIGHSHSVNAVAWDHHGHHLVTAGDDRQIIVWNFSA